MSKNKYYNPIQEIIDHFSEKYKDVEKILEIGPGKIPFKIATHYIDYLPRPELSDKVFVKVNICENKLPFGDNEFDFVYCRHVLEDIHNPDFLFNELKRVCKAGYIETPSPIAECCNVESDKFKGFIHHRYLIWNSNDGVFKMLPKYPIIDLIKISDDVDSYLNHPLCWNSYFVWDEKSQKDIKPKMYYYDLDYDIHTEYHKIIAQGILESIENIKWFSNLISNKIES